METLTQTTAMQDGTTALPRATRVARIPAEGR
jgi:hypothetical protein